MPLFVSPPGMMARPILIVEDDKKIARIVRVYLEGAGFAVVSADTGTEALKAALRESPLAVLLDLMLPDIPGEEIIQELREIGDFPIIMITSKSSEDERIAGFALGADDYVVKPFSPRELVCRVKAVLKRAQKGDLDGDGPVSFNNGHICIDGIRYAVTRGGTTIDITPTEFKVLHTLASYPAKVFTREELVEKALGYQFEGYERSIDAHIKNLRRKIEDDPKNPSLILTVYGVGYRFSGKRDD